MKKILTFVFVSVIILGGCKKLEHAVADLDDRLDKMEGTSLADISEQLDRINGSIDDLKVVDAELEDYIGTLESLSAVLEGDIIAIEEDIESLKSPNGDMDEVLGKIEPVMMEALNSELESLRDAIALLQTKDEDLALAVDSLKIYADEELAASEEWVKATFATLEQYDVVQKELSSIKAVVDGLKEELVGVDEKINSAIDEAIGAVNQELAEVDGKIDAAVGDAVKSLTDAYEAAIVSLKEELTKAYDEKLAASIADSEKSMKEWVSEVLQEDYYTIAEIDGFLAVLKSGYEDVDESLAEQIKGVEDKLEETSELIETAYKKAIEDAIENNNGVFSETVAEAVKEVKDELVNQVDALKQDISEIKSQLELMQNKLDEVVARIQSIRFMPEFSDRCVSFGYKTRSVAIDFKISPASVASELQERWSSDKDVIEGYILYTLTRSSDEPIELDITSVTGTSDGMLTVVLKEDSENTLSDGFWRGKQSASVYISINDGNNDIQSELITTIYTEFEKVEEDASTTYYTKSLEGLLKWAYDVNVGGDVAANLMLETDIVLPQYEIKQNDIMRTYSYTETPITVDDNGKPSGSNWVPIRNVFIDYPDAYSGHVDGNHKTLSGLRMNYTGSYTGFIGYMFDDASLNNLTFVDAVIYSTGSNTGIVGKAHNGAVIENVHVSESKISGKDNVGGLAGYIQRRKGGGKNYDEDFAYIRNCTIDDDSYVTGTSSMVGGICGNVYGSVVIGCNSAAEVKGTDQIGGIAGYARDYWGDMNNSARAYNCYVIGCMSAGQITATNSTGRCGGIIGYTLADIPNHKYTDCYVVACFSSSEVIGNGRRLMIGQVEKRSTIIASIAKKRENCDDTKGDAIMSASHSYDSHSSITEEVVAEMNAAIENYNESSNNEEQTCPYRWTWTSGDWPVLTLVSNADSL